MSKRTLNPYDQISKASLALVEGIKDVITTNVATASSTFLKIEQQQLAKLLTLINASIDEGFHRGSKTFSREVAGIIAVVEEEALDSFDLTPKTKK